MFVYTAILLYNIPIFIDFNLLEIWNVDYLLPADDGKIDKYLMNQLHHLIVKYVENSEIEGFNKRFFMEHQLPYLQNFLYIESKIHHSARLNIFVSFISGYVASHFIRKRILSMYNEEIIVFVEDIEYADIILTDQQGVVAEGIDCFIIKNFLDEQEWRIILRKISMSLLKKIGN